MKTTTTSIWGRNDKMLTPFLNAGQKLKFLYPPYFIWRIKTEKKELFLTFDDGPTEKLTHDILMILKSFNIKATFFCVGDNILKYSDSFQEICAEKHRIGNHTFNHINGWKTSLKTYLNDVEKCRELYPKSIFRPPFGRISHRQAAHLKHLYKIYMWSVLTYDYNKKISPKKCLEIAKRNTERGAIILFHDKKKAKRNMLYALPRFIEHFLGKGYTFNLLDK